MDFGEKKCTEKDLITCACNRFNLTDHNVHITAFYLSKQSPQCDQQYYMYLILPLSNLYVIQQEYAIQKYTFA